MSRLFLLAARYIAYHRSKTVLLILSLALPTFLPVAVYVLLNRFQEELVTRASDTPALVGAKGSRFDLALHALYFEAAAPELIEMSEVRAIQTSRLADAIPVSIRDRAGDFPIVATTLDYFDFRGLQVVRGKHLARLGDCVLGAEVARKLKKRPGDYLLSDSRNVFDLAGEYPLKMRIRGILRPTQSADDRAVFVDLHTGWIIQGIGHGHQELKSEGDEEVLLPSDGDVQVANAALPTHTEITDENISSFHFHGDPATFPITAILVVTDSEKNKTLLEGRYQDSQRGTQLIRPRRVVEELMEMVFRIKRFFDANTILVALSTMLFVTLVVMLSLRLRRREMETMFKLGCSRWTAAGLQAAELGIVSTVALLLVGLATLLTVSLASSIVRWLI